LTAVRCTSPGVRAVSVRLQRRRMIELGVIARSFGISVGQDNVLVRTDTKRLLPRFHKLTKF